MHVPHEREQVTHVNILETLIEIVPFGHVVKQEPVRVYKEVLLMQLRQKDEWRQVMHGDMQELQTLVFELANVP